MLHYANSDRVGFAFVLLLCFGAAGPLWSQSTTFRCDAANSEAIVGVFDERKVSTAANYEQNECRFSIDGAPAGSPPQSRVRSGLAAIDSNELAGRLREDIVEDLAYALIAAAHLESPPEELIQALRANRDVLADCFDLLRGSGERVLVRTESIVCALGGQKEDLGLGPSQRAG